MKKRFIQIIISVFLASFMLLTSLISCKSDSAGAKTTDTEQKTAAETAETAKTTEAGYDTIPAFSDTGKAETDAKQTDPATEAPTEPAVTEAPTEPVITEAPTEPASTAAPVTDPPATEKPDDTTNSHSNDTAKPVDPLDPDKKYVALTFDDGPHKTNSKKITDKMLEYNGKCTFFVIGDLIKGDAEKGMIYAHDHGMQVAIHCWTHDHYYTKEPKYYHDEVYKTADKLYELFGEWPTIMRPPGGNITEEQYKSSEFAVIIWSIDTNDWRYKKNTSDSPREKNIETIVNNCLYDSKGRFNVENGDIILMHEIYENSYDAFCIIIEELHQRGFEFVTVSELLQNPEPGYKYYSATKRK